MRDAIGNLGDFCGAEVVDLRPMPGLARDVSGRDSRRQVHFNHIDIIDRHIELLPIEFTMGIGGVLNNGRSARDYISRQLLPRYLHPAVDIQFEFVVLPMKM